MEVSYEKMARRDVSRLKKAAPRLETQRNVVEHLLIGVVSRVVMWSYFDVGRTPTSAPISDAYRNGHEHDANL